MHCLCISLTFDAFAFPFLTIQSLCWSFSASRFCCTAELNNSSTMPCISLSNLRYTIPLLKSTLLFRCYSFRFLAAPSLVLSIGALHSISLTTQNQPMPPLNYSIHCLNESFPRFHFHYTAKMKSSNPAVFSSNSSQ